MGETRTLGGGAPADGKTLPVHRNTVIFVFSWAPEKPQLYE